MYNDPITGSEPQFPRARAEHISLFMNSDVQTYTKHCSTWAIVMARFIKGFHLPDGFSLFLCHIQDCKHWKSPEIFVALQSPGCVWGRPSESLRSSKTSFKEGRELGRAISFASNASSEARSTITFVPSKKTVTSRAILSLTHWTKPLGNFAFLYHLCTLIRAHLTTLIHDRSCYD